MPAPDSMYVEIEFTAGSWLDVSAWVDWSAGLSTKYGRSQPEEAPQSASMTLTLDNTDGRFSPLTQVRADGVTPHPYWPNVLPRRRIRFGYVISSVRYLRFTGYINGWPPSYKGPRGRRVTISASCRLQQLAQITLSNPYAYEVNQDDPVFYWPLTEPEGSTAAAEANGGLGLVTIYPAPASPPPTFGVDGPGSGNGTGVLFASSSGSTLGLAPGAPPQATLTAASLEVWFKLTVAPGEYQTLASVYDSSGSILEIALTAAGYVFGVASPAGSSTVVITTAAGNPVGAGWCHAVVTLTAGGNLSLYLNDIFISTTPGAALSLSPTTVLVGYGIYGQQGGSGLAGSVGQVAVYNTALSAARVAAHFASGSGWLGETVDVRVARFLAAGQVSSTALAASSVILGTYPQAGQSVLNACQDMAVTEGDGAVVYIDPNDVAAFLARRTGQTGVPDVVLDSVGDLVGDTWAPSYDADQLANSSTVTRATLSGDATVQSFADTDSIATYGLTSDDFTSYATSDDDALGNAQQRIASRSQPRFRLAQVSVDLLTAQTANLYVTLAAAWIGSVLRITNLDPAAAPADTLDIVVQGWADTVSDSAYTITFDTSPVENPLALADDPVYGLAAADQITLASPGLSVSSTALKITTGVNLPMFSTDPGDYPLTLIIGQEQIQLPAPPVVATANTQTFTGVVRGVNGTAAAAQPTGSDVELWPLAVAAL